MSYVKLLHPRQIIFKLNITSTNILKFKLNTIRDVKRRFKYIFKDLNVERCVIFYDLSRADIEAESISSNLQLSADESSWSTIELSKA